MKDPKNRVRISETLRKKISKEQRKLYSNYSNEVWFLTENTVRLNFDKIKNLHLRSVEFHLDHKFSVKEDSVKVILSYPLEDKTKEKLKNVLFSKLDRQVSLEQEIKQDIIGGLIIEIGPFVIDGSLKNRLVKASQIVKKEKGSLENLFQDESK